MLFALLVLLAVGYTIQAVGSEHSPHLPAVAESSLPTQAQQTITLIHDGGPFPYARDGAVFDNRGHELPTEASGYYHEYTVPTPGETTRGARRIITGRAGELYYTSDHYASFQRVDPGR